jgi:hypothetical protein
MLALQPLTTPLTLLRHLTLRKPSSADRPLHLSAASGLVTAGDYFYMVADDENHLGVFSRYNMEAPGELVRVFDGKLPDGKKERKKVKPDLEALTLLPPQPTYPQGALLAIGSGSKDNRQKAVFLALDADGKTQGEPQIIDFTPLYQALGKTFTDLNIEGAFVKDQHLILLQRGNKGENTYSAIIHTDLSVLQQAIFDNAPLANTALQTITRIDIGEAQGVPLAFTDATLLPNGSWLFTAAAEATKDSYNDGEVVATALGVANSAGQITQLYELEAAYKVEGITATVKGDCVEFYMVTDADDPEIPALLLQGELSGYPF